MSTIHAIYEDGVFKPVAPVELPEHSAVEFEPRLVEPTIASNGNSTESVPNGEKPVKTIWDFLDKRFSSGHHDTAAKHDEHQS